MTHIIRDGIELTEEQREFIALARDFAEREIRPRAREVDEADTSRPWTCGPEAAEIGLSAYMLPPEYGGGGVTDLVTQCLVQQELCYGDIGIGNFLTSSAFFAGPVEALGNEEQKKRWLTPLTSAGPRRSPRSPSPSRVSAPTRPSCRRGRSATATHYVLNGQKTWISNAPYAQWIIVFATVDPSLRLQGHHRLPGGARHARRHHRAADAQDGPARHRQRRGVPRQRRVPVEEPPRRGGQGLLRPDAHLRRLSHPHRRRRDRALARRARRDGQVRPGARRSSASRSSSTRRSRSGSPTWRPAPTSPTS